jgi:6-pyruvoyltetrahydropterin/6-carboxytetrahydropterin synthase
MMARSKSSPVAMHVDRPERPQMEMFTEFRFEAAHRLPHVAPDHMCARVHGHSYQVRISVTGPVDPRVGWVMDFADITGAFEPLRLRLDHRSLNEIEGLENPTCERLALWLWERLAPAISLLSAVEVREMPGLGCVYRGPDPSI